MAPPFYSYEFSKYVQFKKPCQSLYYKIWNDKHTKPPNKHQAFIPKLGNSDIRSEQVSLANSNMIVALSQMRLRRVPSNYGEHKYIYIDLELQTTRFFNGCFNWMIPNHYIKNSCFTKHPLKDSCWGYQVHMYMYVSQSTQCSMWYSYTILYYTILYYTILYYTILYYTILSYPILSYPILSYPILYYTIPYHTILYCYISTVVGFQTHLNNIHQMLIVSSIIRVKNSTKKKKNMGFCRPCFSWLENKLQGSFPSTFLLPKTSNPAT